MRFPPDDKKSSNYISIREKIPVASTLSHESQTDFCNILLYHQKNTKQLNAPFGNPELVHEGNKDVVVDMRRDLDRFRSSARCTGSMQLGQHSVPD
jgi:hypothetical protein